ncbi:hypothetical protein E1A91_D05G427500v1 [Gossypium mustelinum]|uniref:Uncharacterized protein n=1 Tax=Gossypium mustelinum TaxID=34275 RepID=A0A5D2V7A2_GOSMU|nr:hypothetical protein E1A91_D05G427500v1 [Gossypium mustelinum]TYI85250.1 hypothetical protein E1A91_D05G427500v1 [Gossypium mustelinum]
MQDFKLWRSFTIEHDFTVGRELLYRKRMRIELLKTWSQSSVTFQLGEHPTIHHLLRGKLGEAALKALP